MSSKQLKILLFAAGGAGTHYYGPGMSAYNLYRNLDPGQASVSLLHGYKGQEQYDLFDEQHYISDFQKKSVVSGGQFLWNARRWIRKNARRFDVVHCLSGYHHAFVPSIWFEREGVPVFIKITAVKHGGFRDSSHVSKLLGLWQYRLRNANRITGYIAISSAIRRSLIDAGVDKQRIYEIPNGVDTKRYRPVEEVEKSNLRRTLGLPDKFTVLFCGSFSRRKNPFSVVEAFEKFKKRKDVQLVLVGPDRDGGEQRTRINKFISRNGLHNVKLFEMVDDPLPWYQASDLFILPSSDEGLSNSLLEAQACGLPALVTKISGSEDLIEEGRNGMFIRSDLESISAAIENYLKNRREFEKQRSGARRLIAEHYSSRNILRRHLKLFEEASRRSAGRKVKSKRKQEA